MELDLDALEQEARVAWDIPSVDVLPLIQRLRDWERINNEILALFTTPDQFPTLRKHALTDAPFHAALRIIETYQEQAKARQAHTIGVMRLKEAADRAANRAEEKLREVENSLLNAQAIGEAAVNQLTDTRARIAQLEHTLGLAECPLCHQPAKFGRGSVTDSYEGRTELCSDPYGIHAALADLGEK